MSRNRWITAAVSVFAANLALAWWVKGDLEMGWLVGGPMILAGGLIFGALAAVLLRRSVKAAALVFAASCVWSLALAAIAIQTPHSWSGAPSRAMARAAERFAGDPAALRAAAEKVTDFPVEPSRAAVRYTPSHMRKIGFSFRIERRPAEAHVVVGFDAGPVNAFEFKVAGGPSGWRLEPVRARPLPLTLRRAVIERRFPGVPLVEVGGPWPYSPGELIPVRLARSETNWEIAIVRLAAGNDVLRETRRYARADIEAGLRAEAARAGLGQIDAISIYFRPVGSQDVIFEAAPAFRFIVRLKSARYAMATMEARLSGSALSFAVERAIELGPPMNTDKRR